MAVLLAEHRLERCLAAADRVVALDAGGRLRRRCRAEFLPGPGSRPDADDARRAALLPGRDRAAAGRRARRAPRPGEDRAAASWPPSVPPAARPWCVRPLEIRRSGSRASGSSSLTGEEPYDALAVAFNLEIHGERFALMGGNGAGKTTLLRAGGGLIDSSRKPVTGQAEWTTSRPVIGLACSPRTRATSWSASGSATSCPAPLGCAALRAVGLEQALTRPAGPLGRRAAAPRPGIALAGRESEGEGLPGAWRARRADPGYGPGPEGDLAPSSGELADRRRW